MANHRMERVVSTWRHCYVVAFALWAWMLTPCEVLGQPPIPISEVGAAPVEATDRATTDVVPSTNPVVVRGPCDPDYWIVSTRGAKAAVDCGQAVNYVVYRFDGGNPGRIASVEEMTNSLQPGIPVCLMVHGSFVTWESMLNDSAQTYRWLREAAPERPLHIIFYTWDSDDGGIIPHLKVNSLGRRAAMNGFYVADLMSRISHDHPISLIGHSHGTRAISSALHLMAGGVVESKALTIGPQPLRQIRVVMAAAAIDHMWLNPDRRYGLALCPAEAVINLRNPTDFPLLFYPLRMPVSQPALAITGLTRKDRVQLGDSNEKIIDYNVSSMVGFGHIWSHYYNQPGIAALIRHYVYFDETGSHN